MHPIRPRPRGGVFVEKDPLQAVRLDTDQMNKYQRSEGWGSMPSFIGWLMLGGVIGFFLSSLFCAGRIAELGFTNRRKSNDRRTLQTATFPMTDCDRALVVVDRRTQPERRFNWAHFRM